MSVPSTCSSRSRQVHQVVPGDQDAGAGLGALADLAGDGLAERLDVPVVEQLHHPQVLAAAAPARVSSSAGQVEVDVGHRGEQRLFDEGADRLVATCPAGGRGARRRPSPSARTGSAPAATGRPRPCRRRPALIDAADTCGPFARTGCRTSRVSSATMVIRASSLQRHHQEARPLPVCHGTYLRRRRPLTP